MMKLSSWPNFISAPFMLPELSGDILRGADGELLVQLFALPAVAQATQPVDDVAAAVTRCQSPHASRAAPANPAAHASRRAVGLAARRSCGINEPVTSSVQYRAGIETSQGDFHVGEITLDGIEVEGQVGCVAHRPAS